MIRSLIGIWMILIGIVMAIFVINDGKLNSADAVAIALLIGGFITLSSFRREA